MAPHISVSPNYSWKLKDNFKPKMINTEGIKGICYFIVSYLYSSFKFLNVEDEDRFCFLEVTRVSFLFFAIDIYFFVLIHCRLDPSNHRTTASTVCSHKCLWFHMSLIIFIVSLPHHENHKKTQEINEISNYCVFLILHSFRLPDFSF